MRQQTLTARTAGFGRHYLDDKLEAHRRREEAVDAARELLARVAHFGDLGRRFSTADASDLAEVIAEAARRDKWDDDFAVAPREELGRAEEDAQALAAFVAELFRLRRERSHDIADALEMADRFDAKINRAVRAYAS